MTGAPPPPEDPTADPDVPGDIRYDPDLAVHEPMTAPAGPIRPSARRLPLLLFPLGILLLSLMIYALFGLITREGRSSADCLNDIRARRDSAWQAALELSRLVPTEDPAQRDPRFVPELVAVFERSGDADPRLRRYLALSLGQLRDPRGVDALLAALADPDLEVRLYAAWALGAIGDPRAAPRLLPLLESEEPGLRKVTAYAMGALAASRGVEPLKRLLNDPVDDVAWNAALSLARLGDPSGVPLLARMLDRAYLDGVSGIDEDGRRRPLSEARKEQAMLNALRALAITGDTSHLALLRRVRDADPSLVVRQAARETLERLEPSDR